MARRKGASSRKNERSFPTTFASVGGSDGASGGTIRSEEARRLFGDGTMPEMRETRS